MSRDRVGAAVASKLLLVCGTALIARRKAEVMGWFKDFVLGAVGAIFDAAFGGIVDSTPALNFGREK